MRAMAIAAFEIVRILFGNERVAAEGIAEVAALEHRRGVELAGRDVQAVELEDVPQLDKPAIDVTVGDELDGAA
jgi:cobalamin biosynthesis Mg chelatase CobN